MHKVFLGLSLTTYSNVRVENSPIQFWLKLAFLPNRFVPNRFQFRLHSQPFHNLRIASLFLGSFGCAYGRRRLQYLPFVWMHTRVSIGMHTKLYHVLKLRGLLRIDENRIAVNQWKFAKRTGITDCCLINIHQRAFQMNTCFAITYEITNNKLTSEILV